MWTEQLVCASIFRSCPYLWSFWRKSRKIWLRFFAIFPEIFRRWRRSKLWVSFSAFVQLNVLYVILYAATWKAQSAEFPLLSIRAEDWSCSAGDTTTTRTNRPGVVQWIKRRKENALWYKFGKLIRVSARQEQTRVGQVFPGWILTTISLWQLPTILAHQISGKPIFSLMLCCSILVWETLF